MVLAPVAWYLHGAHHHDHRAAVEVFCRVWDVTVVDVVSRVLALLSS
jgi:hypothetical protein